MMMISIQSFGNHILFSFSDNLQSQWNASNIKEEVKDDVDSKDTPELLQANAQLIEQLKNVQNERLSSTPPPHFSHVIKPSDKELELAQNIQNNLIEMVGQLKPGQVIAKDSNLKFEAFLNISKFSGCTRKCRAQCFGSSRHRGN